VPDQTDFIRQLIAMLPRKADLGRYCLLHFQDCLPLHRLCPDWETFEPRNQLLTHYSKNYRSRVRGSWCLIPSS